MGKRSFSNEQGYPFARNNAEGQARARKKNQAKALKRTQQQLRPEYFVPMFSVDRKVLATEETHEFVKRLEKTLPGNYKVFKANTLHMSILNQRRIIGRVRSEGFLPDEDQIHDSAMHLAKELGASLRGIPRNLSMPVGRVDRFGDRSHATKIGLIPKGWKGFNSRYAERADNPDKTILPMPVFVRETHIALGNVVTALSGLENVDGIQTAGLATTPHITIAQKQRGGPISDSEMRAVSTIVEEAMEPIFRDDGDMMSEGISHMELFDPVVRVKTSMDEPAEEMFARSPRLSRFNGLM